MSAQLSGEETARLTIRVASWPEVLEAMSSLRIAVREVRRHKRLSLRAVSAQSGVAFSGLHRFEQGGDIMLGSALALIEWLSRGTYRDPDRDADRAASDGEA